MESKYHNGDIVRVHGYGEIVYDKTGCAMCTEIKWRDTIPSVIGKVGKVEEIVFANEVPLYVLSGIPEKKQWYNEDQLQLA